MTSCVDDAEIAEINLCGALDPDQLALLRSELLRGAGVARLRGAISAEACGELRAAALREAQKLPFDEWPGVWSKRVKDPLEWGGAAAAQVLNQVAERVGPLLESVLGPRAWITSVQALALFPVDEQTLSAEAEAALIAGSLHSDYPYGEFKEGMDRALSHGASADTDATLNFGGWQFPADFHQPRTLQLSVVLDEFTRERGATRVLPGSASFRCRRRADGSASCPVDHSDDGCAGYQSLPSDVVALGGVGCQIPDPLRAEDWRRFEEGHVSVEGVAGDTIVYVGHTWHTIAVNRGTSPRVALLIQVSPFYFAPLEAAAWVTPWFAERRLCRRARELLGLRGTTIEGAGGAGEESSRVPHRCEPRPLRSCTIFAADTLLRLGSTGALYTATAICSAAAFAVAASSWTPRRCSHLGTAGAAVAVVVCGYVLGTTATLRRLDF
eukprot:TRINITY_DN21661_c0_g1_i1.p1 TRINITY_DN21661_c0_g1~~TRINITY_DN21661_c0_g1_i1.p1  ORF type:complete len:441 (+),score=77.76 TRINITY_DN21661_c0_g1_i1:74-1396(+)